MGGSLRNPASFCNVAGLRPSSGRVPNWPSVSGWFHMAVAGPMARTVRDLALTMSAIAGPDARAPISMQDPGLMFARPLERDFRGARIAWSKDLEGLPVEPEVTRVMEAQRKTFADLGCIVEDATPDLRDADEIFSVVRAWNFELAFGGLLKTKRALMKDTVIWNIEEGARLTGPQVGAAEVKRTQLFGRMREFMEKYDFLVAPVVQVLPFDVDVPYPTSINGVELDTYIDWMRSCSRITVTGAPALSVPCGFSRGGLPVGLQIVGRYQDDFGVLQIGHAFEQATGFWKRHPAVALNQQ
jgi:amidase